MPAFTRAGEESGEESAEESAARPVVMGPSPLGDGSTPTPECAARAKYGGANTIWDLCHLLLHGTPDTVSSTCMVCPPDWFRSPHLSYRVGRAPIATLRAMFETMKSRGISVELSIVETLGCVSIARAACFMRM